MLSRLNLFPLSEKVQAKINHWSCKAGHFFSSSACELSLTAKDAIEINAEISAQIDGYLAYWDSETERKKSKAMLRG